jgi:hypothetical protein
LDSNCSKQFAGERWRAGNLGHAPLRRWRVHDSLGDVRQNRSWLRRACQSVRRQCADAYAATVGNADQHRHADFHGDSDSKRNAGAANRDIRSKRNRDADQLRHTDFINRDTHGNIRANNNGDSYSNSGNGDLDSNRDSNRHSNADPTDRHANANGDNDSAGGNQHINRNRGSAYRNANANSSTHIDEHTDGGNRNIDANPCAHCHANCYADSASNTIND